MIILYFYLLPSVHRLSLRYFLIKTEIISVARMEIYGLFYFYREMQFFVVFNGNHTR